MEQSDRNDIDDGQKAKIIFLSLAVLVIILLLWSFYTAYSARQERDAAIQKIELVQQDAGNLEQMLKDQNLINDDLKKKLQLCETKLHAKPAAKKQTASKKASKKTASKSKKKKTR